jgi:hypothetical protein
MIELGLSICGDDRMNDEDFVSHSEAYDTPSARNEMEEVD